MNLGSFGLWKLTMELTRFVKNISRGSSTLRVQQESHILNLLILIESL